MFRLQRLANLHRRLALVQRIKMHAIDAMEEQIVKLGGEFCANGCGISFLNGSFSTPQRLASARTCGKLNLVDFLS
jgi:hypothetical protein